MTTLHEVERIQQAYSQYRERGLAKLLWSQDNPGNRQIITERTREFRRKLQRNDIMPLAKRRVLDIGCGSGAMLAQWTEWGADPDLLYGVDLLSDRVAEARKNFPALYFQQSNAELLNFRDQSFDLVMLSTVFSSILDQQMAKNVAAEVVRVLKPGGAVVWYDFRYNNPRNPNVRGMQLADIRGLFPAFDLRLDSITLLPPLARRLGRLTRLLYPILSCIPFLRTHYLGLLVKPL